MASEERAPEKRSRDLAIEVAETEERIAEALKAIDTLTGNYSDRQLFRTTLLSLRDFTRAAMDDLHDEAEVRHQIRRSREKSEAVLCTLRVKVANAQIRDLDQRRRAQQKATEDQWKVEKTEREVRLRLEEAERGEILKAKVLKEKVGLAMAVIGFVFVLVILAVSLKNRASFATAGSIAAAAGILGVILQLLLGGHERGPAGTSSLE